MGPLHHAGNSRGIFPAGYNNAYQIVQSRGFVVIHYEMIHAARIIPTDGRPHLATNLRFWDGDSVGHWEGNTLVVDTANYNGKGWIATNAAAGASEAFRRATHCTSLSVSREPTKRRSTTR